MTIFYAQPYDISASGFYFHTIEDYRASVRNLRNEFGDPVEEFEIQFIDGEAIDSALAQAWGIDQCNIGRFIEITDEWDDDQKRRFIIAVGECGYSFDAASVDADDFDVDIYPTETLKDLAYEFVEEGLFGDIPSHLAHYIDHEAIARDLSFDYVEANIAGERLVYRCA